jgi:hypothetical protein
MKHSIITCLLTCLILSSSYATTISPEELDTEWDFYGIGSKAAQNRMFYMEEAAGSSGVMLVSPEPFAGDLTLRYEIMPMSAASVCVAILYATDKGEATTLTMPEGYDGSMGHWINEVDNYFFAFHNAAHDRTPFAIRFPEKQGLGEHPANVLRSGVFQTVEITRQGNTLRMSIDGEVLFEGNDSNPLSSGHIAFRLRGIPQQTASCLIRNVEIEK